LLFKLKVCLLRRKKRPPEAAAKHGLDFGNVQRQVLATKFRQTR
jgi:hypothetical protein